MCLVGIGGFDLCGGRDDALGTVWTERHSTVRRSESRALRGDMLPKAHRTCLERGKKGGRFFAFRWFSPLCLVARAAIPVLLPRFRVSRNLCGVTFAGLRARANVHVGDVWCVFLCSFFTVWFIAAPLPFIVGRASFVAVVSHVRWTSVWYLLLSHRSDGLRRQA